MSSSLRCLRCVLICFAGLMLVSTARADEPDEVVPDAPATSVTVPHSRPHKSKQKHEDRTDALSDPGDPWGDEHGGFELGALSLRSLLQTRYTATFAESSSNPRASYALREDYLVRQDDGWVLNRFFVRVAGADPSGLAAVKGILDFAELRQGNSSSVVKQAYATLRPVQKRLHISAGVIKLPFSTLELDPIAKFELADVGPADALTKDLGFAGRDVGVEVMMAPLPKPEQLHLTIGAYRGHAHEEHASLLGAVGARLETRPLKGLRLGLDFVDLPYSIAYQNPFDTSKKDVLPNPPDPFFPTQKDWGAGHAWSADVTFERWRFKFRVEGMLGTRIDLDSNYGARTFGAIWAILAYRFHLGPVQLMPAIRGEWLDGDREHATGRHRTLSFGLTTILSKYTRLLFDVTRNDVERDSPLLHQPKPLQAQPFFDLPNTRLVGQFQVEL
jgi:hypothetical protein